MRRRALTLLGPLAVLALAAGGCTGGGGKKAGDGAVATSSTAAPALSAVTVRARDYGFDAPPEIEGGVVHLTLQNDGKLKHEAVVVDAGDTPLDQLKADLTPVVKGDGKP